MNAPLSFPPLPTTREEPPRSLDMLLTAAFLLGAVLGTLLGKAADLSLVSSGILPSELSSLRSVPFFWIIASISLPCLLLVFLSTSYTGLVLTPVFFFLRSFSFSFSSLVLLRIGLHPSELLTLLWFPGLFIISASIHLGRNAMLGSYRVRRALNGDGPVYLRFFTGRDRSLCFLFLAVGALLRRYLILP